MALLNTKDALCVIPLVQLGLQPHETYGQLMDALLVLDDAVEQICGRVERRVVRERDKLKALEARIEVCTAKANGLANNKANATVLYSAAKYPAPKKCEPFERLFYDEDVLRERGRKEMQVPEEPPVESFAMMAERRRALDRAVRADTIPVEQGGYSPIADYEFDLSLRPELACNNPPPPEVKTDLTQGPMPSFITTSASTVLFNSDRGVYTDATPIDNR